MGMAIFIISLAVVFLTTILAYVVSRLGFQGAWPPPDAPPLPALLIGSTVLIVVSSGSMLRAVASVRADRLEHLQRWIVVTFVLGVGFLVVQGLAWRELVAAHFLVDDHLYAWAFYLLTGIHAAHLLGGLVPMAVVLVRSSKRRYSSERYQGIQMLATYWHFLDLAWIGLYATLIWGASE
jgi:cytochrome c oxidase subunit 3